MFSYRISLIFQYSSNNAATAVVRGNTLEVYDLSPLKILWDFGVVCLNSLHPVVLVFIFVVLAYVIKGYKRLSDGKNRLKQLN